MAVAIVATEGLMLRTESRVVPETEIRPLPLCHRLDVIGDDPRPGWKKVSVQIDGTVLAGVISGRYLRDELSPAREKLVQECAAHWHAWGHGFGREHWSEGQKYCLTNGERPGVPSSKPCGSQVTSDKDYYKLVGTMWKKIQQNLDGKDRGQPWSAAFISLMVRNAGYEKFAFAPRHGIYVKQAIEAKLGGIADSDFWGFEIDKHKPQLGDLVCQWRSTKIDYKYASKHDSYKSHCDVVVEIRPDTVRTIGGNTSNEFGNVCVDTVGMKSYSLNAQGFLKGSRNEFAILRNNR